MDLGVSASLPSLGTTGRQLWGGLERLDEVGTHPPGPSPSLSPLGFGLRLAAPWQPLWGKLSCARPVLNASLALDASLPAQPNCAALMKAAVLSDDPSPCQSGLAHG